MPALTRALAPVLLLTLSACAGLKPGGAVITAAPGTCPAASHQDWVGQRIDALNDVELPKGTRVLFPTTPTAADVSAARLNIAVDKTDKITRVYCG